MPPSPQDILKPSPLPVDPAEKKTDSSATDGAVTNEESTPPEELAVDSFVPLLEALDSSGVHLLDGKYHLRGTISSESVEKLSNYARTITCFTLTKEGPPVDPGTWLYLVQLLTRHHASKNIESIFPSLNELIIKSDASLAHLALFTVPSLKYLEVSDFSLSSEIHQDAVWTLFHIVAHGAPNLNTIYLDKNVQYTLPTHLACMRFSQLRELWLGNMGPKLNWTILRDLGQLQTLEIFQFNAQTTDYTSRAQSDMTAQADEKMQAVLQGSKSAAESASNESYPTLTSEVLSRTVHSPEAKELLVSEPSTLSAKSNEPSPHSSAVGFCKLRTLYIVAKMDLMSDIIDFLGSKEMVNISLTLIIPKSPHQTLVSSLPPKKEDELAASIPDDSEWFHAITKKALASGVQSLTTMEVLCFQEISSTNNAPTSESLDSSRVDLVLRGRTLLELLSHSNLCHLEISGWRIKCDLETLLSDFFTALPQPSKLDSLHLPFNSSGISLRMLRIALEHCPCLVSFRCGFKKLAVVPPYAVDGAVSGLKVLGVGYTQVPARDLADLVNIAQYLDALCPNLENIENEESRYTKQWEDIMKLVKMCQRARSVRTVPKSHSLLRTDLTNLPERDTAAEMV